MESMPEVRLRPAALKKAMIEMHELHAEEMKNVALRIDEALLKTENLLKEVK